MQRWRLINASVITCFSVAQKPGQDGEIQCSFYKDQISLSVLMCFCLPNECNAYDGANSCLKIKQWSADTHNGNLSGPEPQLLERSLTAKQPFFGTVMWAGKNPSVFWSSLVWSAC